MKNLENFTFLNKEIIVEEIPSDNPLDNIDDSDDLDKLVECKIVKLGLAVDPTKQLFIGDNILVQRDALKVKDHPALKNYRIVFHENGIFCKL